MTDSLTKSMWIVSYERDGGQFAIGFRTKDIATRYIIEISGDTYFNVSVNEYMLVEVIE